MILYLSLSTDEGSAGYVCKEVVVPKNQEVSGTFIQIFDPVSLAERSLFFLFSFLDPFGDLFGVARSHGRTVGRGKIETWAISKPKVRFVININRMILTKSYHCKGKKYFTFLNFDFDFVKTPLLVSPSK
jgi:hypothetical protein